MKHFEYTCRKALPSDDACAIAKYIHLTDPYIYPAITNDPCDPAWQRLIAQCLAQKDNLFSLSNISVALCKGEIVGVACVIPCGTPLRFGEALCIPDALQSGIALAGEGYFTPLIEEAAALEGYDITNVCIDKAHRGKGVGHLLMQHCIKEYGDRTLHLDVIANNMAALQLYQKCGFAIHSTYHGFSGKEQPILCYHMIKNAQ